MSATSEPHAGLGELLPVPERPTRIWALGLSYEDHIRETGSGRGAPPIVFSKDVASWLPHGDTVRIPSSADLAQRLRTLEPDVAARVGEALGPLLPMMDYEGEIAIVVLERITSREFGLGKLPRVGFAVANDLTARSIQVLGEGAVDPLAFWRAAKSFPGFLPVSPRMWVPHEAPGPMPDFPIVTYVNGRSRQTGRSRDLVYSLPTMLEVCAERSGELDAGDVILTGTPAGVAFQVTAWKRRLANVLFNRIGRLGAAYRTYVRSGDFLQPGDVVEVEAGPLGSRRVTLTV